MIDLSILIPAYNYPKGVSRILSVLNPLPYGVEVIIFDDSPTDVVEKVVKNYSSKNIIYSKNSPAKGAVNNWNSLLEAAQGRYIMLLHHDECPLGGAFLNNLLGALRHSSSDVLMMDVFLIGSNGAVIRKHMFSVIREFVVRYLPAYLFSRNVIGPTGSLIIRRVIHPRYDSKLRWFVDVDFYFRLRQETKRWKSLFGVGIGSILDDHESITKKLFKELEDIKKRERIYLNVLYPNQTFWINLQVNSISKVVEFVIWGAVRFIQIIFSKLLSNQIK